MNFQIGNRVELAEGVDRAFRSGEFSEHGTVITFFSMPLGDINGIWMAEIAWDDGSISSVPLAAIELEDLSDDFWIDDIEDDLGLEDLF